MSAPNRTVIVTGASSGIGRATALLLAEHGYDVGLTYSSNAARAQATADAIEALGQRAAVRPMKLESPDSVQAAIHDLADALGGLDALVNNAGLNRLQPFLDMPLQTWREVIDADLTGTFLCAQAAARRMLMQRRGGRIVNVSSVHAAVPLLEGAAYCAAKGGVAMLTQVMALELAPHGITVNAVAPGETATPMSGAREDEDVYARGRPHLPLGRPGHPREVAAAIAHLISPEASYTTGASLFIDGGMMLMAAIPNQHTIMAALRDQGAVT